MQPDPAQIAAIARADKAQVAAALNLVEDRRESAQTRIVALLGALEGREGGQRVGLTGPPGVGKSTLTAALALEWRRRGSTVGVLAVDPSSVRSGGALLGDRVRMAFDPSDQGLFVRSLATAGDTGGLSYAAAAVVEVLSSAYDRVLVETVGVGQSETAVEQVVDTVCLVVQPGSGDALQFIKAGIMEIPDLIVVNKGDHKLLAERAAADLRGALSALGRAGMTHGAAETPVIVTSARDKTGIDALADALEQQRRAHSEHALRERRHRGAVAWTVFAFQRRYGDYGVAALGGSESLASLSSDRLSTGQVPLSVVADLGAMFLSALRDGAARA